jgi:hypothetical protein
MIVSLLVVLGCGIVAVAGSWWYYRTVPMPRPPFGVFNLRDVAIAMVALAALPHLYRLLPLPVIAIILTLITIAGLHATLQPVVRGALLWVGCLTLVGADLVAGLVAGVTSEAFLTINNLVAVIMAIGIANLWAQGGMKARDLGIFAAALTVYDIVVTWQFTIMLDLIVQLSQLPLFPMVAWGLDDVADTALMGIGDLLMVTLAPLVLRKAYGRTAGLVAVVTCTGTICAVLVLLATEVLGHTIPVMAFLGPVIALQCLYWRKARGDERTTRQYLLAEPPTRRLVTARPGGR